MAEMVKEIDESLPTEYWEWVGETTRWGRYLADKERSVIHRGLELAWRPGNAVDVGCGGGRWSKILADAGWQVTCIEVDETALRQCKHKMPSANCVLIEPSESGIRCASSSQHLLLCMEAPEVIEKEWFAPEAYRILEEAGYVVGFYMNPQSWRGIAWRLRRTTNGIGGRHYFGPSYSAWRRNFLSRGFEMVHEESFTWAPFGRESDSPLIPVATTLEELLGLNRLTRFAPWLLFVARKKRALLTAAQSRIPQM